MPDHYRTAAPPPTTAIRLSALDPAAVRIALGIFFGAILVMAIAILGTAFVPRADRALARVAVMGGVLVTMTAALLVMRPRMSKLHYVLELGDAGSGRLRLLAPNGAPVADTANGTLRVARTNYTRRGRHGSAWSRPGFRLHHPHGTCLVGTLLPQLPWDDVTHDPSMPDFELTIPDHEALAQAIAPPPLTAARG